MKRLLLLLVPLCAAPALTAAPVLVTDAEGRPVEGADVEARAVPATASPLAALGGPLGAATTDARGEADLPLPQLDGGVLLLVDHPGYVPHVAPVAGGGREVVRLGRGRRLEGRARGAQRAITTGRACARWRERLDELRRERSWERCADLDAEGRFAISGLAADAVELTVESPGFLPWRQEVGPGALLDVELASGVLVEGRVRGAGGPLHGATVETAGTVKATTDRDGRFAMAVAALPVELAVSATGHRTANAAVRAEPGKPQKAVEVTLRPGEQLLATLVGEQSLPIEKAEVWIERQTGRGWQSRRESVELPAGELRLDLPGPGAYRLRVRAAGYRVEHLGPFEVAAGEAERLGVVGLARGAVIGGRAVDAASGEGLPGVAVDVRPHGAQAIAAYLSGGSSRAVTDAHGHFELPGLDAGRVLVRAERAGYAQRTAQADLHRDTMVDVGVLEMEAGVDVRGRVVDRRGEPRPGVAVRFFDEEAGAIEPLVEATTDGAGRFKGVALASGGYQVRVTGERLLLAQAIEVPRGERRHDLELVAGGVRLRGRVLRRGEPAAGGVLTFTADLDPGLRRGKVLLNTAGELDPSTTSLGTPESTVTCEVGADGSFEVSDAPAGLLWATLWTTAGEPPGRQVAVPDQAEAWVELDFSGATLAGRVTDRTTEGGVEAEVRVTAELGERVSTVRSDAEGRFAVPDLAPGVYVIEAAASGYRSAVRMGVRIAAGEPAEPVSLVLDPGEEGSLAVRLSRTDGSPAGWVQVSLLDASGGLVRALPTDAFGIRLFEDLPAGRYFVVWSDALAGTGVSREVQVAAGEAAEVTEVLGDGATLDLVCAAERCGGALVDVLALFSEQGLEISPYLQAVAPSMRFSQDGTLRLGRVSPGRFTLLLAAGGAETRRSLAVGPGSALVVEMP